MFSVLAASAFLPFLTMLSIHLLIQNLLYDISQTLIVHMIRTRCIPFVQSNGAWPLMLMTFAIMAIGIAIPFTPFGAYIGLMPLPQSYFPWLVAILLSYCVLTQVIKQWYIKRFGGEWL